MVKCLKLRTSPDFSATTIESNRRVQRLHRRVCKERKFVLRQNALRRRNAIHRRRTATGHGDVPGGSCQFTIFGEQLCRVRVFDRGSIPLRLQAVARLLCCPESVCYDSDSSSAHERDLKNVAHTGNRARSIGVEALHPGSKYRRMRHQSDFHPGQIHIEPKFLRSVTLPATIKAAGVLATEMKLTFLLKLNTFRDGQLGGGFRQLTVFCGLAVRSIGNAGGRPALLGHHVPLSGRGRDQHGARPGSQLTILFEGVRNGTGAAHHLNTCYRVAIDIGGGSKLGNHLRPIGIHLIG